MKKIALTDVKVNTNKRPDDEWARGRNALMVEIEKALLASGYRVLSGTYTITVERVSTEL